jgi:nicotinate phosphoribosyltransferase
LAGHPRLKVTSDLAKATLPGHKRLLRAMDPEGGFIQDVICLAGEEVRPGDTVYDPANPLQHKTIPPDAILADLHDVVMADGRRTRPQEPLADMAARCRQQLASLPQGCLRLINPHRYKVSISSDLLAMRNSLLQRLPLFEGRDTP